MDNWMWMRMRRPARPRRSRWWRPCSRAARGCWGWRGWRRSWTPGAAPSRHGGRGSGSISHLVATHIIDNRHMSGPDSWSCLESWLRWEEGPRPCSWCWGRTPWLGGRAWRGRGWWHLPADWTRLEAARPLYSHWPPGPGILPLHKLQDSSLQTLHTMATGIINDEEPWVASGRL